LPIVPEIEEMLISLRNTSLPSAASAFAASRQCGARARAIRKGTMVWISSIAWNCLSSIRLDDAVPGIAGIVDHDVDRPKGIHRRLDQLVRGALLGEVAGVNGGLGVDLARGLLGDVGVEVVDQHLRPLAREQLRGGAADAPSRAGDDRALAVK